MIFNHIHNGKTLTVQVIGGIADDDIHDLKHQLQEILKQPFEECIFDFSQLQFMCSSAIGRLLMFYKNVTATGRHMRVKGMTEYIHSLFEFTNLNLLFPMEF